VWGGGSPERRFCKRGFRGALSCKNGCPGTGTSLPEFRMALGWGETEPHGVSTAVVNGVLALWSTLN
jgi:hypothetical protein